MCAVWSTPGADPGMEYAWSTPGVRLEYGRCHSSRPRLARGCAAPLELDRPNQSPYSTVHTQPPQVEDARLEGGVILKMNLHKSWITT